MQGTGVQFPVRELRSHMPIGVAKKIIETKKTSICKIFFLRSNILKRKKKKHVASGPVNIIDQLVSLNRYEGK